MQTVGHVQKLNWLGTDSLSHGLLHVRDAVQHVRIRFLCILEDISRDDIFHIVWCGRDVNHDFLLYVIILDDFELH